MQPHIPGAKCYSNLTNKREKENFVTDATMLDQTKQVCITYQKLNAISAW